MIHYKKYPSISKILKATESEESKAVLERWNNSLPPGEAEKIKQAALKRGITIDESISGYNVDGICSNQVLNNYLSQYKILAIEEDCFSDKYQYWGRFDQILLKGEKKIINDFKGSGKPKQKQWLNDNPIQLSAYYFALLEQGKAIDYGQLSYLVDGKDEVQKFVFTPGELQKYFNEFLQRVEKYHLLENALR